MEEEFSKIKLAFFMGQINQDIVSLCTDMSTFRDSLNDETQKTLINSFIRRLQGVEENLQIEQIIDICES